MSFWPRTAVLVTGAAGFIGGRLARRLHALGARVHAVSRSPRAAADGLTWHAADLRDPAAAERLLAEVRPEVLFHLASAVDGSREPGRVGATLDGNLRGAVNLMTAAGRHGVRVVLAGSIEEPRPGNGHSPPSSPYAMAKWAATGYAELFHRLWALPVTVLRPSMVYGPAQRDTGKLVPYVTLALLHGESPKLTDGGKEADWVYVDDVVEAFVAAGEESRATGQAIDVGTGRQTSVRALVAKLHAIVGGDAAPVFGALPARPFDIRQLADVAPAADLLGWRATTGLDEGLVKTVEWYDTQHWRTP